MQKPEDFIGYVGTELNPPERQGFTNMPILEILNGKPWDEAALACCSALRPSFIRVTEGPVSYDIKPYRITVTINEHGIIQHIEQEVWVYLPERISHGHALISAIEHGLDSPEFLEANRKVE